MKRAVRPRYDNLTQQLLTFAVVVAGKNAIFKFPRLLLLYVPFLFAYVTFTVSAVIPIMHLESTLSQFSGSGNIGIFDTVPAMRGLGYTMSFYFTLGLIVFSTECSYSTVFLANWFRSPLAWADCSQPWSGDACYVPKKNVVLCSSIYEQMMERYRNSRVMEGVPVTDGKSTVFVPEHVYNNLSGVDCINGSESATKAFFK
ncbi:hypothetical protein HPB48_010103 [Haemaphysalis longicornis]|uniref:Uncharacterized protein n=1 Tax=Haemaphysalis longicornis TaxID=44386 RepID=A0A9J6FPA4_HAELO|nr:hypothetical protein HPB48_010103 [Haemaphysalis longicornis]